MEVCMTINNSWVFNINDDNHKSSAQLIRTLARCAGVGANFPLPYVGPSALGEILPIHTVRLAKVGKWLARNGESIYGTRAGVIQTPAGVTSTTKGEISYIHIFDNISDCINLDHVPAQITTAHPIGSRRIACKVITHRR